MPILRAFVLLLAAAAAWCADPWRPLPDLLVKPDGRLLAGSLGLELQHKNAAWKTTSPRYAVLGAGAATGAGTAWRLDAPWRLGAVDARVTQTVRRVADDTVEIEAAIDGAGETRSWGLALTLDGTTYRGGELRLDGRALPLPVSSPKIDLHQGPARLVAVPLPAGGWLELSGTLTVQVQDTFSTNVDAFKVVLLAGKDRRLSARLRLRPLAISPLPLGAAAATARSDDKPGDREGGWTDQGDRDLRRLASGPLVAAGLTFQVEDNAAVLGGERFPWARPQAVIPVNGRSGASLYLLHASARRADPAASGRLGTITVVYKDGSRDRLEIEHGRTLADWWSPRQDLADGVLGWTCDMGAGTAGLYVSRFPLADRPLDRLELASAGDGLWLVVAAALGDSTPLPAPGPEVITAGPRWRALPVSWEVLPGSALDLSSLNPGPVPARLEARGGDLVLAGGDGAPVRLQGANLCFNVNFPEPALARRLARALRAMGHNSVRIHHMDGFMGEAPELDAEQMDRLDYLFACCKQEGLWVVTDLFVSRTVPRGAIPELPDKAFRLTFKPLVPLLPSAMANWKRFATAFLTHRNPYTGLSWGEDPALAGLSLSNEDNFHVQHVRDPDIVALVERRFAAWMASRPAAEQDAAGREAAKARWMRDLQAAACAEMRAHVRSLGVHASTSSANYLNDWWSMAVRDGFDHIENHAYHDHAAFPINDWRLPHVYHQQGAVERLLKVPLDMAPTRRLDKPFLVTELSYCMPNHQRAEYAAGVPAVAGLQGWSGIWRFAFAEDVGFAVDGADASARGYASSFDFCRDPIALLAERAVALLYRRGDVAPGPWAAALVYDPAVAGGQPPYRNPPASVATLGLHTRIGCLPAASAQTAAGPDVRVLLEDAANGGAAGRGRLPVVKADGDLAKALVAAGLVPADAIDPAARRVRSADGQLDIDANAKRLWVATRRSVAAVLPGGAEATLGGVAIANRDAEPATVVVAALDGADLATSRRLLVLHLTDAQNTGTRYGNRRHTILEDWGRAPLLARAGAVQVVLPGSAPATAYALDLRGARREEQLLAADGAGRRLDANVLRDWGPCLAWEVVR